MQRAKLQTSLSRFIKLKVKNLYCINGITSGYLKSSPLGALTLAMITQITLRVPINIIIGMPMIIKHRGIARTI